ncbi:MAG: DUF2807 domain-containing protein [Ignavibacteria bacterium]|nr:DUF2807 domain-containing protein [Ignavibacteria bacterium]
MKQFLIFSSLIIFFIISCDVVGIKGSGNVRNVQRETEYFNQINVSGSFEVEVVQDDSNTLVIEAEDNLIPYIVTKVRNNTLFIDTNERISPQEELKVFITVSDLKKVDISGACKVSLKTIEREKLDIELSGASNISVSGKTDEFNLFVSGASKIDAVNFYAKNVNAKISGASRADLNASSNLNADISGASTINYYGDPANIKYNCSGASSLNRR